MLNQYPEQKSGKLMEQESQPKKTDKTKICRIEKCPKTFVKKLLGKNIAKPNAVRITNAMSMAVKVNAY